MSEQVENEQPSSLRLVRRDQAQRMARFYTMHSAPTLFGGWDLVREWGRIGSPGTLRITPLRDVGGIRTRLTAHRKAKKKTGISLKLWLQCFHAVDTLHQ